MRWSPKKIKFHHIILGPDLEEEKKFKHYFDEKVLVVLDNPVKPILVPLKMPYSYICHTYSLFAKITYLNALSTSRSTVVSITFLPLGNFGKMTSLEAAIFFLSVATILVELVVVVT